MRYQFLEIKVIRGVEVAYVLDTETGKVYKSEVESWSDNTYDDVEELPASVKKIQPLKIPKRKNATVEDEEVEEDNFPKPKPAMIPPALRGVFMPEGTPGAAIETRRV